MMNEWYEVFAKYYDLSHGSGKVVPYEQVADKLHHIFKKHKISTVLDMACGTGTFTILLKRKGYDVVGVDYSKAMLSEAKKKARLSKLKIKLLQGDMRSSRIEKFDAAICTFNAIAHLTPRDFEKAIINFHNNLKAGGLIIFDIFNWNWFEKHAKKEMFVDRYRDEKSKAMVVEFNHSVLNIEKKILGVHQTTFVQDKQLKMFLNDEDMQLYTAEDLDRILRKHKFRVIRRFDYSDKGLIPFDKNKSKFIVTLAEAI